MLLGAPIGWDVNKKRQLLQQLIHDQLPILDTLQHSAITRQEAMLVVRASTSQLLGYLTRVVEPSILSNACQEFDHAILDFVVTKLELPQLSDQQITQLRLPLRHGGFGLPATALTSPIAYTSAFMLASSTLSEALVLGKSGFRPNAVFEIGVRAAVSSTRQQVQSNSKALDLLPPASSFTSDKPTVLEWTLRNLPGVGHVPRKFQHTLSLAAGKARLDSLKQPADKPTLARLLSVSAPLASAWIGATPKNKLTTLPNKAYSNAARYTLGLPYTNAPDIQHCVCNYKKACTDLHHPLSCLKVRKIEVNLRHDTLNFIGHKFFRKLGLPAQIESQNIGGTQQRADTQVTDKDGESFLLDWSVVQPTCPSHVKAGSHKAQLAHSNTSCSTETQRE